MRSDVSSTLQTVKTNNNQQQQKTKTKTKTYTHTHTQNRHRKCYRRSGEAINILGIDERLPNYPT